MAEWINKTIGRVRAIGPLHQLGYARVALRCALRPPPPRGSFPPASAAVKKPAGLVALGGCLTPESLREAHGKGIYPMYFKPPVKWWSPDPRVVLFLEKMRIEKRGLRKLAKSGRYRVTFDTCFAEVIHRCGNRDTTWLTEEVMQAYIGLHRQGHAHSVEVWDEEGALVGGLYGIAAGRVFSTESAFQLARDTIRIAFMHLNCHLQHWGCRINDMQVASPLAESLGCEAIAREQYCALLAEAGNGSTPTGPWHVDASLDVASWEPAGIVNP